MPDNLTPSPIQHSQFNIQHSTSDLPLALATAPQLRHILGQVQHRGRLDATMAAVDDQINLVFEPAADVLGIGDRKFLTRQDQRATHDRLAQFIQQGVHDGMIHHTDADGAPFRVHQAARHLGGGIENKGVRPRCQLLQQAVVLVADFGIGGDFGQIAAHQSQIVFFIDLAQPAQALHGIFVADVTAQRIAGVGRIDDQAAAMDDVDRLFDQAHLWMRRVDFEILAHGHCVSGTKRAILPQRAPNHYNGSLQPVAGDSGLMKLLFDFFPIILFFASYYQAGFLVENTFLGKLVDSGQPDYIVATIIATAVAIVASFVQVGMHWFKTRRVEKTHLFSLVLISVLGGVTIVLGDPAFVQWKPTVLNWLFAAAFLLSMFIGNKNLIQRAMSEQISLPDFVWTRLNLAWVAFFIVSGALNLYVAFYYQLDQDEQTRMDFWVNFKLFGLMGLTVVFVILQALYLSRHLSDDDENNDSPP